jgi:TRAP-type uncharacterized transport system substrate-binding protein
MIIYLFLILILFYFYNKNKNKKIEGFYTLFNPYTMGNKKIEDYNYKKYKHINLYITNNLYDTTNNYLEFLFYYLKLNISKGNNNYDILLNYNYNQKTILEQLSKNKNSISYVSYPSLYKNINKNIFNNIRFMFNSNNHYLIPLTNDIKIDSLNKIKNKMEIIIDEINSSSYTILEIIFKYLNKTENIDYIYIYKKNVKNILNSLIEKKYKIGFISISFPSTYFTNIMKNNKLNILDYSDLNMDILINNYFYLNMKDFNLSNVSDNYLPYNLRNKNYTIYKPYIKLINYKYLFISNKNSNKDIIYNLCKNYYENINILNTLNQFKDNKLDIIDSFNLNYNNLFIHDGSEKFMNDIGIITYEKNKNCINFVSKLKCDKNNLIKYNYI